MFADELKKAMEARGLLAPELSRLSGLSPAAIDSMVRGRVSSPQALSVVRLSVVLDLPMDFLFQEERDSFRKYTNEVKRLKSRTVFAKGK